MVGGVPSSVEPSRIAIGVVSVLGVVLAVGGVIMVRQSRAPRAPEAAAATPAGARRPVVRAAAPNQRIRELVVGDEQTCALYTSGSVECWGPHTHRSLGLTGDDATPLSIPGIANAVAVTVGADHGCALDADGWLSCWGYCDPACAAGTGPPLMPVAARVATVPRLRAITSEGYGDYSCGVGADDEQLHCWGPTRLSANWFGDPVPPSIYYSAPDRNGTGQRAPRAHQGAVELTTSTSGGARCARYDDDTVRCWSDGMTDGEGKRFASLDGPTVPVIWMSASSSQQCFVLRTGQVQCHSTDGVIRPPLREPARTAAAGGGSVCATGRDGSLLCYRYRWDGGDRNVARLGGHITFGDAETPAIGGRARTVVGSTFQFCALREDDAVLCWSGYSPAEPKRIPLRG